MTERTERSGNALGSGIVWGIVIWAVIIALVVIFV